MATAHQIRDQITEITTSALRPRVPREVREEVCRCAARRREQGAPWAVIARETGLSLIESAKLCDGEPRAHLREATRRAVRSPGTVALARDLKSARS